MESRELIAIKNFSIGSLRPGTKGIPFTLVFKENYFNKGDIINKKVKVIKVLDRVWWRRLLIWLKFKQPTNSIIVKEI